MRVEFLTLVVVMAGATVLTAACDYPPQPEIRQSSSAAAQPAPSVSSSSERKDAQPPVQGEVDPKEAAQRRDFQQR